MDGRTAAESISQSVREKHAKYLLPAVANYYQGGKRKSSTTF